MQNAVTPFLFEGEHLIRVVMQDAEPWFVAADVCRAIGIKNPTMAVEPLDDDEKGLSSTETLGGHQEVVIVSEGGLYTIVLRSRAATTPGSAPWRFRKWITSEVLPQIRKTGFYSMTESEPEIEGEPSDEPSLSEKRQLVTEARHTFDVMAARELWFKLNLPITPAMIQPAQADLFYKPKTIDLTPGHN